MLSEHTKHRIIGGVVLLAMITAGLPALLQRNAAKFAEERTSALSFVKASPSKEVQIRRFVPRDIAHVTIRSDAPVEALKASLPKRVIPIKSVRPVPKRVSHVASVSIKAKKPVLALQQPEPSAAAQAKTLLKPKLIAAKAPFKAPVPVVNAKPQKPIVKTISQTRYHAAPKEQFAIQLGSFASLENAVNLINQLRKSGYQAKYIPLVRPSGTLYKVVVGRLTNKDSAKLLNARLSQTYHVQGFVVAYG